MLKKCLFQKLFKPFRIPIEKHILNNHINLQDNLIIILIPQIHPEDFEVLNNAEEGISSIRQPSPEKMLKKCSLSHHFEYPQYRARLDVFS